MRNKGETYPGELHSLLDIVFTLSDNNRS